jgi:hypothetical protein
VPADPRKGFPGLVAVRTSVCACSLRPRSAGSVERRTLPRTGELTRGDRRECSLPNPRRASRADMSFEPIRLADVLRRIAGPSGFSARRAAALALQASRNPRRCRLTTPPMASAEWLLAPSQCWACEPRPAQGDVSDRELPLGCPRWPFERCEDCGHSQHCRRAAGSASGRAS